MSDPQHPHSRDPEVPPTQSAGNPDHQPPAHSAWQPDAQAQDPGTPPPPAQQPGVDAPRQDSGHHGQPAYRDQPGSSEQHGYRDEPGRQDAAYPPRSADQSQQPGWQSGNDQAGWQGGQQVDAARGKRPGVVTAGVIVMAAVAIIGLIMNFVSLGTLSQLGDAVVAQVMPLVIMGVVMSIVLLVLSWFVWKGKNWARITLAVVVVINAIVGIMSGAGPGWLGIVGVVLLFLPAANEWFKRR